LESFGWGCWVQAITKLFATFINSEWFPLLERILVIIHGNNAICTCRNKSHQFVKWQKRKKMNLKRLNNKRKREQKCTVLTMSRPGSEWKMLSHGSRVILDRI
jgi:hypothetical protein